MAENGKAEKEQVREAEENADTVTPWDVQSKSDKGIDYEKLISMYKRHESALYN